MSCGSLACDMCGWFWCWVVWGGEEVFVLVHLCQEVELRDGGGLLVAELVVVFEDGSCVGKKLVGSFTFSLFLCASYLLLRVCGWFDLLSEDSHVVQCVAVGSDGRVENVQRSTVFCMMRGL